MPSTLGKIFGRRGSNASNVSNDSVDSDESFQCCGIPADFYDPKFDSEEEIAPPPNYYVLPPPLPKKIEIPEPMETLNIESERLPQSAPAQTRRRAHTVGDGSPSKSKSAPARRVKFNDVVQFSPDAPRSISPPEDEISHSAPAHRTEFQESNTKGKNRSENQDEGPSAENAVSAPAHVTQFDDLTDSEETGSQGSSSNLASLRKRAHRHVRFHAGFDTRLADNFPRFPIEREEEVETLNEKTLSTSRSEGTLRESRFLFQTPKFLKKKEK